MLRALEVKPSGLPPQDPYTQLFLPLIVVLLFNCFLIQLFQSYSVCGLTPMPHIPNQHHYTQRSAHEVLDAILDPRVSPVFIKNPLYSPFVIESLCLYLLCLSAALLCYTGFQTIH